MLNRRTVIVEISGILGAGYLPDLLRLLVQSLRDIYAIEDGNRYRRIVTRYHLDNTALLKEDQQTHERVTSLLARVAADGSIQDREWRYLLKSLKDSEARFLRGIEYDRRVDIVLRRGGWLGDYFLLHNAPERIAEVRRSLQTKPQLQCFLKADVDKIRHSYKNRHLQELIRLYPGLCCGTPGEAFRHQERCLESVRQYLGGSQDTAVRLIDREHLTIEKYVNQLVPILAEEFRSRGLDVTLRKGLKVSRVPRQSTAGGPAKRLLDKPLPRIEEIPRQAGMLAPLLHAVSRGAIEITDKLDQALELAREDAAREGYTDIYDDSLLTGLILSQGPITHLLSKLVPDLAGFLNRIHTRVPGLARDYRLREKDRKVEVVRRAFGRKKYLSQQPGGEIVREQRERFATLVRQHDSLDSYMLLESIMQMPATWHHVRSIGLSPNKVKRHARSLQSLEPNLEAQKYYLTYDGDRFAIRPFDFVDVVPIPSTEDASRQQSYVCRVNLTASTRFPLEQDIEQLEWLINKPDVSEDDVQRFLEAKKHFLLGAEYRELHSQLALMRDGDSLLKPDFFLERIDGSLADILDLKLPTTRVVVGKKQRRRFSSGVQEAMAQLRVYRQYFEDSKNRAKFHRRYGLRAYKPRLLVVIGRSSEFSHDYERAALESEWIGGRVITYDDLLLRAKNRLEILKRS